MKKYIPLLVTLFLTTLAAILHFIQQHQLSIPPNALAVSRYAALAGFIYLGFTKRTITTWILVSMLIGLEVGYDFPDVATHLQVFSKIFLQLIKTVVGPLLFATLVFGIAGHSNLKQVGRMGWKSMLYFYFATTLALFIGLFAINFSKAGVGIVIPPDYHADLPETKKQNWEDILLHVFPENIAKSVAEGQVLQIVVFSIIFGIALAMLSDRHRKPMLDFCESLSEVMFKFTKIIMYYAPIGVGAAIAYTVGKMGIGVVKPLFNLLLTLYVALIGFVILVFFPIALAARLHLKHFIKAIGKPVALAFATSTSESALPLAMNAMEQFGVPRKVVSFVMPLGYSFNLDGTTLYLSLASVFVAQAAGIDLSLGQQIFMVVTLMLTSKGVAGVPRASLVILIGTAATFNLPMWPITMIFGIDALMDMARTSVNVMGNCLASAVIARWEGELDEEKMNQEPVTV
ncbi:MAG: dicarboxylate/amino acid:cation symporter [Chitinophagaceae bacterium]|nr:dicarboxylate/amino acid:cation symporter [Chitinophagaceae bacterium]